MAHRRMNNTKEREEEILAAAVTASEVKGYQNITREDVAKLAGCSPALITARFSTMPQLRRAIMRAAVRLEVLPIILQGIAAGDPHARKAPEELKKKALARA